MLCVRADADTDYVAAIRILLGLAVVWITSELVFAKETRLFREATVGLLVVLPLALGGLYLAGLSAIHPRKSFLRPRGAKILSVLLIWGILGLAIILIMMVGRGPT